MCARAKARDRDDAGMCACRWSLDTDKETRSLCEDRMCLCGGVHVGQMEKTWATMSFCVKRCCSSRFDAMLIRVCSTLFC